MKTIYVDIKEGYTVDDKGFQKISKVVQKVCKPIPPEPKRHFYFKIPKHTKVKDWSIFSAEIEY